MSESSDSDFKDPGAPPSVSREKWARHALEKLRRGYVLIIPEARRSASFFKPGKGYEACAYQTARQLIRDGYVVEGGEHPLGMRYVPAPHITPLPPAAQDATPKQAKRLDPNEADTDMQAPRTYAFDDVSAEDEEVEEVFEEDEDRFEEETF